jgi:hypothetical protein
MFEQNWEHGYFRGTVGFVEIPIWPFMVALIVGSVATVIQFLLLAYSHLRRALGVPAQTDSAP